MFSAQIDNGLLVSLPATNSPCPHTAQLDHSETQPRRAVSSTKQGHTQEKVESFVGFPGGSAVKESTCNAGDLGSIPALGRSPGEGNSYPLQCSGLENPMDYPSGHKESDTVVQLSLILWIK